MSFHCFGEPASPTVVLIHGLATTWEQSFGEIIPLLAARYHVVAVGLSGHDPAEPGDFVSRRREAEELSSFLTSERGGEAHCVYGASLGAAVAVELAWLGSARVGTLVLDGAVKLPVGPLARLLAVPMGPVGRAVIDGRGDWFLTVAGVTPEALHDLVYRKVSVTSLRNGFIEGFGMFAAIQHAPVRTDVGVVCWFGGKERLAPASIRALRRTFPRLTVRMFPGCGHGELLKRPEQFVDELVASLEGSGPDTTPER
ncbi:MAG TPA: alpha/beta hydrolase [Propionibacteriaceae bacterium]|nr:alpha/beta hydrolase [Propionibacteriaceae bacterium]